MRLRAFPHLWFLWIICKVWVLIFFKYSVEFLFEAYCPGFLFLRSFLITGSTSILVIGLFKFSFSFTFSLGRLCVQKLICFFYSHILDSRNLDLNNFGSPYSGHHIYYSNSVYPFSTTLAFAVVCLFICLVTWLFQLSSFFPQCAAYDVVPQRI